MKFDWTSVALYLAAFTPTVALYLAVSWDRHRRKRVEKSPQTEKLLRLPGGSGEGGKGDHAKIRKMGGGIFGVYQAFGRKETPPQTRSDVLLPENGQARTDGFRKCNSGAVSPKKVARIPRRSLERSWRGKRGDSINLVLSVEGPWRNRPVVPQVVAGKDQIFVHPSVAEKSFPLDTACPGGGR